MGDAGRLLSVNVGLPREIDWRGQRVRTAIWKHPVEGRRLVRRLNVEGDGQADLVGHGGEQRAVFVYQIDSYRHWQEHLGRDDLVFGQFGENFTVEGLSDEDVSVGDRYRIGGAVFEVTQPRVTCYRVGIRMDEPRMPSLLVGHGRPGFYMRVLEEGEVGAGDAIEPLTEGPGGPSVREVNDLLYLPGHPTRMLERALAVPALSPGWRGSFEELLEQANGTPAAAAPPWPGFRPFEVVAVHDESASVRSIALERAGGPDLPGWSPGQFITLRLALAGAARPLVRTYSLSGAVHASRYRIGVKREPGGRASGHLHTAIAVGDMLDVAAPRGGFTLDAAEPAGDRPIALVSAGVGATPVLSMLTALAEAASPRRVWWVHGARSRDEHPFAEEVRALVSSLSDGRGHVRYTRPGPDDVLGRDHDAVGRVDAAALRELGVPADSDFYLCGPPGFLADLREGLTAWGVPAERLRSEVFGPGSEGAATPYPPHAPAGLPGTGPEVVFARSGLAVPWDRAYASLLELAEACDVPVRWSCRTGVCHTCEAGLVDGAVDYRPDPLDPPVEGSILTCCARPRSTVTLDL